MVIGIIASDERSREELKLAVEELGYRAACALDLKGGMELIRAQSPRLMLVAQDPSERTAESLLAELEREAPLLPVVVALKARAAARAMELLKSGVFEVVAPPFTPESLSSCLSKALRFKGTAFEVTRPEHEGRGLSRYFATAAIMVCLAVGYSAFQRHRRLIREGGKAAPQSAWDLPYSHPAGLAFDGGVLWASDWYSRTLYRHDPSDLRVLRADHMARQTPGAIVFAGDALWVVSEPRSIVKHMLDDRLGVIGSYEDKAPQTLGMAYDGLHLWTCDGRRLHKRVLDEELSVVESYEYPGEKPAALAYDGTALWSLDAGNRELLRHDLSNPVLVKRRIPLPEYRSGQWKPLGLAWANGRFWTLAQRLPSGRGAARIFSHELAGAL